MQSIARESSANRRAQALGRMLRGLWRTGVAKRPDLASLRAEGAAMRPEAHEHGWQEALGKLLDSLEQEARLNEVGLTFAFVQLRRLLRQRTRAERLWRAEPRILDTAIARPVIVLGSMRSGTTRLQRLLGCDPRFNHTRFFEITSPLAPRPGWRIAESWAQLKLLDYLNPTLQAVHPTSPRAVEEAFGLLSFSFYGAQFEAQWRVPGFTRYWEAQDRSGPYREFKRLIQTIAWKRGASSVPWVLKAPQFMEDLEPLLEAFPDARLICLHRDPSEIVTSSASLVWNQMSIQSDAADREWIGAEWLRKTARRQAICAKVRAARPDVPQLDVEFGAMNADWRREMRRIYGFLDLELTLDVERSMARYLHDAEASGFRHHRYRPGDFGLDPQAIGAALTGTRAVAAR